MIPDVRLQRARRDVARVGEPIRLDLILSIGSAVAEEHYGVRVPVLVLPRARLDAIRDGVPVDLDRADPPIGNGPEGSAPDPRAAPIVAP